MNNAFTVFALLLWAAAAALLIWLPRIWRRGGAPETNEDWLRLRQRELAERQRRHSYMRKPR